MNIKMSKKKNQCSHRQSE